MGVVAKDDLMDRFEAVLPWVDPADEAREILGVMARIGGAACAAVFVERGGVLRWLAGDALSDETARAITNAWRLQRTRILTGSVFTDPSPGPGEIKPLRSRLMWMRRPVDGGLDAVYLAGTDLRPLDRCAARLTSLAALLGRLTTGFS